MDTSLFSTILQRQYHENNRNIIEQNLQFIKSCLWVVFLFFPYSALAVEFNQPEFQHKTRITSWFLTVNSLEDIPKKQSEHGNLPDSHHFNGDVRLLSADENGDIILFDGRNGHVVNNYGPAIRMDKLIDDLTSIGNYIIESVIEKGELYHLADDMCDIWGDICLSFHYYMMKEAIANGIAYSKPEAAMASTGAYNLTISPSKKCFAYSEKLESFGFFPNISYTSGIQSNASVSVCVRNLDTGNRIGMIDEINGLESMYVLSMNFHEHSFDNVDYLEIIYATPEGVKQGLYAVHPDKIEVLTEIPGFLLKKQPQKLPFFPSYSGLVRGENEHDINRSLRAFFEEEIIWNVYGFDKYQMRDKKLRNSKENELRNELKYYNWSAVVQ